MRIAFRFRSVARHSLRIVANNLIGKIKLWWEHVFSVQMKMNENNGHNTNILE